MAQNNLTASAVIELQRQKLLKQEWQERATEEYRRLEERQRMMMQGQPLDLITLREPYVFFDPVSGQLEHLSKAPLTEPDRKLIPRLGVLLAAEGEGEHALAKEAEALLGYSVLRRKLKIPGKLGEVLACLDIEPLDFNAVEKYKADMVLWRRKELETAARDLRQLRRYYIEISWRRVALGSCAEEVPLFALRKAVQVKKACPEAILEVDELIEEKKLIDPFLVARLEDETYYLEVWKEPKFEETL